MKRIVYPIIMAIYLFIGIIASVGAINYGIDSTETVYTIAGIINGLFCALGVYEAWKRWKTNK